MKFREFQHEPVKPDTYEASMALNQLLKIGKHAIKIHNMIDDRAEMESWVAKKIDLAGDYVKKVHGYMQGEKAGLYDDGGMSEIKKMPEGTGTMYGVKEDAPFGSGMDLVRMAVMRKFISAEEYMAFAKELKAAGEETAEHYDDWPDGEGFGSSDGNFAIRDMMSAAGYQFDDQDTSGRFIVTKMPEKLEKMGIKNVRMRDAVTTDSLEVRLETKLRESREEIGDYAKEKKTGKIVRIVDFQDDIYTISYGEDKGENDVEAKDLEFLDQTGMDQEEIGKFDEDAGEGHMSKSTLYHTAKYAIELMGMIQKGDDLEGWVQSKLNKAADYLQGVHNYEEYQKLNPYREELDSNILNKHARVVQKNIDEILARETKVDDIDTKPGMMRILAKRVNEVEKEIAKENRKKGTNESGILYRAGVKKYGKSGMKAIQSAAGKGASHQEIGKIKDKHLKDAEDLEEGLKDWARNVAAAGIIVGAVAGVGSINNAIDNSIPAVKAMNTAYEMAVDAGNTELAKNIKNDLSAVKVRLDSGKDLNFVKSMQEKYAKFIQTEGLAYESQLQVQLNQQLK